MCKNKIFQDKLNCIHKGKLRLSDNSNYIKNNIKVNIICSCGYTWDVLPMQLTRTKKPTGCPKCSNNLKHTTETFKLLVQSETNGEYLVKGEYLNSLTKIEMFHTKCNKLYLVRPNDFQQGYRCPNCSHGHTKKTQLEFENEIKELTKGEYIVASEYKGCSKYVLMEHIECGQFFNVTARNFISNKTRCPYCAKNLSSKGTRLIEHVLIKNNIAFNKELILEGLKYKRNLKLDFYINSLNLYIEFDGEQHFKNNFDRKKDSLSENRLRDRIKNKYFMDKKLSLLRIDDTNYENFEYILNEIINKRSTTIEKFNLFYIEKGNLLFDNNKYVDLSRVHSK